MSSTEFKVAIHRLQVEHLREPLGIGTDRPRLSWQVQTDTQNWTQSDYEIECNRADGHLKEKTGRILSGGDRRNNPTRCESRWHPGDRDGEWAIQDR